MTMNSQWIEKYSSEFAPNAVGVDPVYEDEFYKIKEEINKLGNLNFILIRDEAQKLLVEKSKDLRVLIYLVFARTQLEGFQGFIEALTLLIMLYEKHFENIHPEKISTRLAILKWLDNDRLNGFLIEKIAQAGKDTLKISIEKIEKFNYLILKQDPASLPQLKVLKQQLETQLQRLENHQHELTKAATIDKAESASDLESISHLGTLPSECQSEQDIQDFTLLQINYLQTKEQYLRAASYSRALRWSELYTPPHTQQVTRMSAPREVAILGLQALLEQDEPLTLYKRCEELFLEGNGHLWLDLQFYAAKAARRMGNDPLAHYIEAELQILLKRIPLLPKLYFSDNRPFASSACLVWIEKLFETSPKASEAGRRQASQDLSEVINSLRAQLGDKNLTDRILFIQQLATFDERSRFQSQLAMGRFCLEENRVELAIPVLQKLVNQVSVYRLDIWEPNLAMAAWIELRKALKAKLPSVEKTQQIAIQQELETLFGLMCQTDTVQAMSA